MYNRTPWFRVQVVPQLHVPQAKLLLLMFLDAPTLHHRQHETLHLLFYQLTSLNGFVCQGPVAVNRLQGAPQSSGVWAGCWVPSIGLAAFLAGLFLFVSIAPAALSSTCNNRRFWQAAAWRDTAGFCFFCCWFFVLFFASCSVAYGQVFADSSPFLLDPP